MRTSPWAITMWDFSWLERRWPGAGYEDWDRALSELTERGYDAVRIDAYPHLVAADPMKEWYLPPAWNQTSWGAQSPITVQILPALTDFIAACRRHGVKVGLSTWYREDADNLRMQIRTPQQQGQIWLDTLRHIEAAGLLDQIIFVDFCNEFPHPVWAPYLYPDGPESPHIPRADPRLVSWMAESIAMVREQFPTLDYTYSFCTELHTWAEQPDPGLDLLELHIWMSHRESSDFNARVGYGFERFEPTGFDNLVAHARREFTQNAAAYEAGLFRTIDSAIEWSKARHLGIVTTECWAVIDWKDWPGLDWDWVMELTEKGLRRAAASGRWLGLATSNFCGPQFVGMWREVEWHRRLTDLIKNSPVAPDIRPACGIDPGGGSD